MVLGKIITPTTHAAAAHTVMLIRNFLNAKKKENLNIASSADYTERLLSLHTCIGQGSILSWQGILDWFVLPHDK